MNAPRGADHLSPQFFTLLTDHVVCRSSLWLAGYFYWNCGNKDFAPGVLIPQSEMWSFLQMFTLSDPQNWKSFNWCGRSIIYFFACFLLRTWKCTMMSYQSPAWWVFCTLVACHMDYLLQTCHRFLISFTVSRASSTLLFNSIVCVYL